MAVYTFYMHKKREAVPSFEIASFDDPDAALAHGQRLLQERPRYALVEVVCGEESLAKLTREAP